MTRYNHSFTDTLFTFLAFATMIASIIQLYWIFKYETDFFLEYLNITTGSKSLVSSIFFYLLILAVSASITFSFHLKTVVGVISILYALSIFDFNLPLTDWLNQRGIPTPNNPELSETKKEEAAPKGFKTFTAEQWETYLEKNDFKKHKALTDQQLNVWCVKSHTGSVAAYRNCTTGYTWKKQENG